MIVRFFKHEIVLMFLLLFGYLFRESFVLFQDETIHPFPYYKKVAINRQSWIMMAGEYAIFAIMSWVIYCRPVITSFYFRVALLLSCAEFIEFYLCYNHRWFDTAFPINVTIFRFVILPIIIIYYISKWKTLQSRAGQFG